MSELEVRSDVVEVDAPDPSAGLAILEEHGLDPAEWRIASFRTSEWSMHGGETGVSTRFQFERVVNRVVQYNIDELLAATRDWEPQQNPSTGDYGFLVLLGDTQFGKIDGDGVEGTWKRVIAYLNKAHDLLWEYARRFPIGHVHIGFLGDHIEGFNSQGGANVWRTGLTLSEQIRLTRRMMLHALLTFADSAEKVTMAAVPGNHGETVRFAGKGITRYDDSHDTESLIAVSDAAGLNPAAFEHVEFFVPACDEMVVTVPVAGTTISHVHGHQFRPGRHFDWWEGQAFHNPDLYQSDLLVSGHLHHEFVESNGKRLFIQVPAMESESTWWRHLKGTPGNPGLIVAATKDGVVSPLEIVR